MSSDTEGPAPRRQPVNPSVKPAMWDASVHIAQVPCAENDLSHPWALLHGYNFGDDEPEELSVASTSGTSPQDK